MALSWVTTKLPPIFVNKAYNLALVGAGGTAPYTYTIASGSLPTGLSLLSGVISGTITDTTLVGKTSLRLRLRDSLGASVDQVFEVHVRQKTTKVDYKLDDEVEDGLYVSQHNDTPQKLHGLVAKLLYWGLSASYEELLNTQSILQESWTSVVTGATADTKLEDVLLDLAGWDNDVAYPAFATVSAVTTISPTICEFTITSPDNNIFVGTVPADYNYLFLLTSATYNPYISSDNGQFVVTSVTPGAITDGQTGTVTLQAQYQPNPTSIAFPAPPFVCVYSLVKEVRDIPMESIPLIYRLIQNLITTLAAEGVQKLNTVPADSSGSIYVRGGHSTNLFEYPATNTLFINDATAGLTNNKLSGGTRIQHRGSVATSRDGKAETTFKHSNEVNLTQPTTAHGISETEVRSHGIAAELAQIQLSKLYGTLIGDLNDPMHQSPYELVINDRRYRDSFGPADPYATLPMICRGDNIKSFISRLQKTSYSSSRDWYGVQLNPIQQKFFIGRPADDYTLTWSSEGWCSDLEEEFTTSSYVARAFNVGNLNTTAPFLWVSPYLRQTSGPGPGLDFDLNMAVYNSGGGTWNNVTTLASFSGATGAPAWTPSVGWITVAHFDDKGVAGAEETHTIAASGDEFSINCGMRITNAANFWTAIGSQSCLVAFFPSNAAQTEFGIPTYVFVDNDSAFNITNHTITDIPDEILLSGIGYWPGDYPLRQSFTLTDFTAYDTDGIGPLVWDYPVEYQNLTKGSTFLPASFTTAAGLVTMTHSYLGDDVMMQELLGTSGKTAAAAPTSAYNNVLNVWGAGNILSTTSPATAALSIGNKNPIAVRNGSGSLISHIIGEEYSSGLVELFHNEHYRLNPSDHSNFNGFVEPKAPDNGKENLFGWISDVTLGAADLEVGCFQNPLYGTTYTVDTQPFYDATYYLAGLRKQQEDYPTTRPLFTGTNRDYSTSTSDQVYYRVFLLDKPITNLSAIQFFGFKTGPASIDTASFIAAADIQAHIKVPGPDLVSWVDVLTGTPANISWGGATVGCQFTNIGLGADSYQGNYMIVVRVTIPHNPPTSNAILLTGIKVIP